MISVRIKLSKEWIAKSYILQYLFIASIQVVIFNESTNLNNLPFWNISENNTKKNEVK